MLSVFGISRENVSGVVSFLSQLFFEGVEYGGEPYRLSVKPTPDQLTRMFTRADIAFRSADNETVLDVVEPMDADGYVLSEHLADSLFEAEAAGLTDSVRPIAKAFSDHGKEHLMLELFAVLHNHYTNQPELYRRADGGQSPAKGANLRSYEPMMLDVFEQGTLLDSLNTHSRS